tara:strand:- start:1316 stop:1492 length:177 start_codon:yes stop_codon:yes gene_type:complete
MKYTLIVILALVWLYRVLSDPVQPRVQVIQNHEMYFDPMTTEDLEAWHGVEDLDELTD